MKIIIPAAGQGRRLQPYTFTTPKVLIPVAGKPIIGHIFDRLMNLHPEEILTVINPQQQGPIQKYLETNFDLPVRFVEQEAPLGLGDAVRLALNLCPNSPVLILLGDTILELDVAGMVGPDNRIGVQAVNDPRRFGVVEIKDGSICRVIEKPETPPTNLAIVGIYYFNDSLPLAAALEKLVRENRTTGGEYQLTDGFQLMIDAGVTIKTYPVKKWLDCGTVESLLTTNRYLLEKNQSYDLREGTVIVPPVFIAPSSHIESSTIGPYATIGEKTEIHNSTIRDSIIDEGAMIENAVIEKSFIGKNTEVRRPARLP